MQNEFNEVIYSEPDKLEYRDDSLYPNGYEEPDVYNDDEENSEKDNVKEKDETETEDEQSDDNKKPAASQQEKPK